MTRSNWHQNSNKSGSIIVGLTGEPTTQITQVNHATTENLDTSSTPHSTIVLAAVIFDAKRFPEGLGRVLKLATTD